MFSGELTCRLTLLEALIPVFGVGKGDGFSLEQLMQFVGKAFGNSNADVRAAATRVTILVLLVLHLRYLHAKEFAQMMTDIEDGTCTCGVALKQSASWFMPSHCGRASSC